MAKVSNYPGLYSTFPSDETPPVGLPIQIQTSPPFNPESLKEEIQWPTDIPAPTWRHNSRLLRPLGTFFTCSGVATATLTTYLFFYMRGRPDTIIRTVRTGAVTAFCLTSSGLWLRFKPYWLDRRYCVDRAREAVKDIEIRQLGYKDMRQHYGHLLKPSLLSDEQLRILVQNDIEALSEKFDYEQFERKHGKEVLSILDTKQKINLRYRFLNLLSKKDIDRSKFSQTYSNEKDQLEIPDDEINYFFREQEAVKLPFDEFRRLHRESVASYSDAVRSQLIRSYLALPYPLMKQYQEDKTALRIQDSDIRIAMLSEAQRLSYKQFVQRHTLEVVKDLMINQGTFILLRQGFLSLPYREMGQADRETLGFHAKEDPTIAEVVNTFIETHPYIGAGNAREKHKEAVLDGVPYADNLTKIREELKRHLGDKRYSEIKQFEEERRAVQLGDDWVAATLRSSLTNYADFESRHGLAPLKDGILTIQDQCTLADSFITFIQADFNRLRNCSEAWKILGIATRLAELQQHAKLRLQSISSFEEFLKAFPEEAFSLGILEPHRARLQQLTRAFFQKRPYWRRCEEGAYQTMIRHNLFDEPLSRAIHNSKINEKNALSQRNRSIEAAKTEYAIATEQAEATFKQQLEKIERFLAPTKQHLMDEQARLLQAQLILRKTEQAIGQIEVDTHQALTEADKKYREGQQALERPLREARTDRDNARSQLDRARQDLLNLERVREQVRQLESELNAKGPEDSQQGYSAAMAYRNCKAALDKARAEQSRLEGLPARIRDLDAQIRRFDDNITRYEGEKSRQEPALQKEKSEAIARAEERSRIGLTPLYREKSRQEATVRQSEQLVRRAQESLSQWEIKANRDHRKANDAYHSNLKDAREEEYLAQRRAQEQYDRAVQQIDQAFLTQLAG